MKNNCSRRDFLAAGLVFPVAAIRNPVHALQVTQAPKLTYRMLGKTGLKVTGDLTIHGVTKPVVLAVEALSPEVKDPWGNTRRGASATATLNRKDWGLVWNKLLEAGPVLGDEVKIEIETELVKAAPQQGTK